MIFKDIKKENLKPDYIGKVVLARVVKGDPISYVLWENIEDVSTAKPMEGVSFDWNKYFYFIADDRHQILTELNGKLSEMYNSSAIRLSKNSKMILATYHNKYADINISEIAATLSIFGISKEVLVEYLGTRLKLQNFREDAMVDFLFDSVHRYLDIQKLYQKLISIDSDLWTEVNIIR